MAYEPLNLASAKHEEDRLATELEKIHRRFNAIGIETHKDFNESPVTPSAKEACIVAAQLIKNQIKAAQFQDGDKEPIDDDFKEMLLIEENSLTNERSWLSSANDSSQNFEVSLGSDDECDVSQIMLSVNDVDTCVLTLLPFPAKCDSSPKKGSSASKATASPEKSPRMRRRLTTTINATPSLIPDLAHLSRTNNRPLSSSKDLTWEQGAPDQEAPPPPDMQPAAQRGVPAHLIQRLQELKAANASVCLPNNIVSPPKPTQTRLAGQSMMENSSPQKPPQTFRLAPALSQQVDPMSVSQFMREAPDWDNEGPESYLSLNDTSLLHIATGAGDFKVPFPHLNGIGEGESRMTIGGILLPPRNVAREQHILEQSHHDSIGDAERRQTMGGVHLPQRSMAVPLDDPAHFSLLAPDHLGLTFTQDDDDDVVNQVFNGQTADENCNTDAKLTHGIKEYSSQLFDTTFSKNLQNADETLKTVNGVELNMFPVAANNACEVARSEVMMSGTFTRSEQRKSAFVPMEHLNLTFSPEPKTDELNGTFTRPENRKSGLAAIESNLPFRLPESLAGIRGDQTVRIEKPLIKHDIMQATFTADEQMVQTTFTTNENARKIVNDGLVSKSRDNLDSNDTNAMNIHYSTATYTRPTARTSPGRSGLPMRRGVSSSRISSEDLARSPCRSDGSITPVEGRPAAGLGTYTRNSPVHGTYTRNSPISVIGTYTRNSPVERCGSEDEQMSTTSDRSQDSVEDIHDRCKPVMPIKSSVRHVSTPRNSVEGCPPPDEWHASPISRNQSVSADNLLSRGLRGSLHGPVPLKLALVRPTENFKRPAVRKSEVPATPAASSGPLRGLTAKPLGGSRSSLLPSKPSEVAGPARVKSSSGLPQPTRSALPSRIPGARLSAIPRPGAVGKKPT